MTIPSLGIRFLFQQKHGSNTKVEEEVPSDDPASEVTITDEMIERLRDLVMQTLQSRHEEWLEKRRLAEELANAASAGAAAQADKKGSAANAQKKGSAASPSMSSASADKSKAPKTTTNAPLTASAAMDGSSPRMARSARLGKIDFLLFYFRTSFFLFVDGYILF